MIEGTRDNESQREREGETESEKEGEQEREKVRQKRGCSTTNTRFGSACTYGRYGHSGCWRFMFQGMVLKHCWTHQTSVPS